MCLCYGQWTSEELKKEGENQWEAHMVVINLLVIFRENTTKNYVTKKKGIWIYVNFLLGSGASLKNLVFLVSPEIRCSKRFTSSFHNETWDRHFDMNNYFPFSSVNIFVILFSLSNVYGLTQHITHSSFLLSLPVFVYMLINTFVLVCVSITFSLAQHNTYNNASDRRTAFRDLCWRCLRCVERSYGRQATEQTDDELTQLAK